MWIQLYKTTKSKRKIKLSYREKLEEQKRLIKIKRKWKKQ